MPTAHQRQSSVSAKLSISQPTNTASTPPSSSTLRLKPRPRCQQIMEQPNVFRRYLELNWAAPQAAQTSKPAEQFPGDESVCAVITSSPGRCQCQTQESFLGHPMTHISWPYALLWPPTAGDELLGQRDLWSDPAHLVLCLGVCSRNFLAVPGKSSSVLLIWKASVLPKLLACQRKPLEELQAGAVPMPHPSPWLQTPPHVSLQRAQRSSWLRQGLAKPHSVSPFQPPVFPHDL